MGVLHMPTAAGHHPLKSCPRHEAPPQIILKSVTFTMTTDSPPRAPPLCSVCEREGFSHDRAGKNDIKRVLSSQAKLGQF